MNLNDLKNPERTVFALDEELLPCELVINSSNRFPMHNLQDIPLIAKSLFPKNKIKAFQANLILAEKYNDFMKETMGNMVIWPYKFLSDSTPKNAIGYEIGVSEERDKIEICLSIDMIETVTSESFVIQPTSRTKYRSVVKDILLEWIDREAEINSPVYYVLLSNFQSLALQLTAELNGILVFKHRTRSRFAKDKFRQKIRMLRCSPKALAISGFFKQKPLLSKI